MAGKISMGARREVVSAVTERYRSAKRTEKGRIMVGCGIAPTRMRASGPSPSPAKSRRPGSRLKPPPSRSRRSSTESATPAPSAHPKTEAASAALADGLEPLVQQAIEVLYVRLGRLGFEAPASATDFRRRQTLDKLH